MKNKKNIILIVVFVLCLTILIVLINKKDKNNNGAFINTKVIYSIVKDYDDFYTIENCANKFYGYLGSNNVDSINKLLDKSFTVLYTS